MAAGDPSMIDFSSRIAAQQKLPELNVVNNYKNLLEAHMRGDAVLAQGHLQTGRFPDKPYRLRNGKLEFQNVDGIWITPSKSYFKEGPKGTIDFVIVQKGGKMKLIIGSEHSGLSGGSTSVIGAGELKFNKHGIIENITNGSGHYRPSVENLQRSFDILSQQGFLMPNKHVVSIDPVTNPNP